jgi:polyisoprenoid-binding protein YceI
MQSRTWLIAAAVVALAGGFGIARAAVESTDAARVEAGTYAIDPSHVAVAARVDHLGFTKATLRFTRVAGSFDYDPGNPQAARLDVTIDTASLTTDWEARDKELRSPAFFNAAAFPQARYVATSLVKIDSSHARVNGQLTLLGLTRTVPMDVTLIGTGTGMRNDRRAGFFATMKFNRSDFGMKAFLPAVGNAVEVSIDAEFSRK